jgi:hypothetical protein
MRFAWNIVILAISFASACTVEQPVSGPIALTDEWATVEPPKPLRVAGKNAQALCLQVPTLRNVDLQNGVVLVDGRHVLEGEAIDNEGSQYSLRVASLQGDIVCLYRAGERPPGPDFPAKRTIIKLRLRSTPPLQVEKIRWRSYDPF